MFFGEWILAFVVAHISIATLYSLHLEVCPRQTNFVYKPIVLPGLYSEVLAYCFRVFSFSDRLFCCQQSPLVTRPSLYNSTIFVFICWRVWPTTLCRQPDAPYQSVIWHQQPQGCIRKMDVPVSLQQRRVGIRTSFQSSTCWNQGHRHHFDSSPESPSQHTTPPYVIRR